MSFWDNINEKLKKALDEGFDALKEGGKAAAEKSEELAKLGKLKYESYNAHKKAEKLMAELGGMVFDMAKPPFENPLSNHEVMELVEKIKEAEKEIKKIEAKVEKEKDDSADNSKDNPIDGDS